LDIIDFSGWIYKNLFYFEYFPKPETDLLFSRDLLMVAKKQYGRLNLRTGTEL
jgi:hypothetical protein